MQSSWAAAAEAVCGSPRGTPAGKVDSDDFRGGAAQEREESEDFLTRLLAELHHFSANSKNLAQTK